MELHERHLPFHSFQCGPAAWHLGATYGPSTLQLSESALQHATHCASRALQQQGRQSLPSAYYTVISRCSLIQIWPSCCFYILSAGRVRYQTLAGVHVAHRFIELLNASNKSTHMLCISRKLRSFWTEWFSYHICLCSRMYILNNLIHQLHNMFHFTVHQGAQIQVTDSWYTHWLGIQDACTGCQNVCATAVWMSLKVGIVDYMHGKTGERVTKLVAACDKKYTYIYCWIWPWGDVSLLILGGNYHKKNTYVVSGLPMWQFVLSLSGYQCKCGWSRMWLNLTSIADSRWQRQYHDVVFVKNSPR